MPLGPPVLAARDPYEARRRPDYDDEEIAEVLEKRYDPETCEVLYDSHCLCLCSPSHPPKPPSPRLLGWLTKG